MSCQIVKVVARLNQVIAVTGLVERKVHPSLVLVVIGKGALVGIVRRSQVAIAVAGLDLQGDLTPSVDQSGSIFFTIPGNLAGKRPNHRICAIARHQIAGKVLLMLHAIIAANRKRPCLAKRVDQTGIGDIGHAAIKLLPVESNIGQILCALGHTAVNPVATICAHVRAQVGLVDGKSLLGTQVDHAAELTRHARVVRLVPALAVGKLPVGVAEPKKRRAIRIGK